MASAAEPPGVAVLSFATAVAHAAGDEEAEHHYTAGLLARAQATEGDPLWLDAVHFLSGNGHPGEAIELAEPYLRDHPDDSGAAFTYSVMLREADGLPSPGDRERAALERFAGASGLAKVKRAVLEFMGRTEWGELVMSKSASGLDLVPRIRRYLPFPAGALDGAPRWSVWLGGAIPVDGVRRATGTGTWPSPAEADAVAEAVDTAAKRLIITTSGGIPLAETLRTLKR